MCGNTQVRFLEGKGAVRLPTYSTKLYSQTSFFMLNKNSGYMTDFHALV